VFANGREVACAAGSGKTICAMPDVCFTPPENPATPPGVPVPYPNTALASDTTDGSKSVQISGKEIMLKNKSNFKTSSGDEAGAAAKKGVVSSKNKGKVYFTNWSMDVKFEGENAVRHLDMTTNNHGSPLANEAVPWPFVDSMADDNIDKTACDEDKAKEKEACKDYKPYKKGGKDVCKEAGVGSGFTSVKGATTTRAKKASENPCSAARRCVLRPFNKEPRDGIKGCCPAQTPDHLVPKSSFFKTSVDAGKKMKGWGNYSIGKAPCMCLEGGSCSGTHGLRSTHHKTTAGAGITSGDTRTFDSEVAHCAKGAKKVAPQCKQACIEAQLKEGHREMAGDPKPDVKYSPTGKNDISVFDSIVEVIKEAVVKSGRGLR